MCRQSPHLDGCSWYSVLRLINVLFKTPAVLVEQNRRHSTSIGVLISHSSILVYIKGGRHEEVTDR